MSGVIRKSVSLLTAIIPEEEKEEWSATEVSRKLNLPIQTVHRLLSSLAEHGFVYQNKETKKFRLGLTLMQLGLSIRDNLLVRNSALPIMEKIMKKTNKSVYLTIPEGDEGVFIDSVDADLKLKISESIGKRTPLCTGAFNKVILAHMSPEIRKGIIEKLTKKGYSNECKIIEDELKIIRKNGIAISCEEGIKEKISIAAPIFSWENKVIASISIIAFKTRYKDQETEHIMQQVKKAAEEISEELGWINLR